MQHEQTIITWANHCNIVENDKMQKDKIQKLPNKNRTKYKHGKIKMGKDKKYQNTN